MISPVWRRKTLEKILATGTSVSLKCNCFSFLFLHLFGVFDLSSVILTIQVAKNLSSVVGIRSIPLFLITSTRHFTLLLFRFTIYKHFVTLLLFIFTIYKHFVSMLLFMFTSFGHFTHCCCSYLQAFCRHFRPDNLLLRMGVDANLGKNCVYHCILSKPLFFQCKTCPVSLILPCRLQVHYCHK